MHIKTCHISNVIKTQHSNVRSSSHLLLRRVKAESPHEEGDLLEVYKVARVPELHRVLALAPDLRVVEEVLDLPDQLALLAAAQQPVERLEVLAAEQRRRLQCTAVFA